MDQYDIWGDVPDYMRPLSPKEFKDERMALFQKEFKDHLGDAKRYARSFRHLQIAYRETDKNHILGEGIPEWHIICDLDGQSIVRIFSGGQPFNFDIIWLETSVIRHFHQRHPEKVNVKESSVYGKNEALDSSGGSVLHNRNARSVSGFRNQKRNSGGSESGS